MVKMPGLLWAGHSNCVSSTYTSKYGYDELGLWADYLRSALRDLVGPPAAVALLVVGEAGRTVVPVGLPVHADPEYPAVIGVLQSGLPS